MHAATFAFIAFALGAANAFTPAVTGRPSTALNNIGAGGMFDTRNPEPMDHRDSRMSISKAPSFEEYLKKSGGMGGAAPAPAAAPAQSFGGMGGGSSFGSSFGSGEMGGGSQFGVGRNSRASPSTPAPAPAPAAPAPAGGAQSFEEYMRSRGGSVSSAASAPAVAPASGGAQSFEEYMRSRGGAAPAAPAASSFGSGEMGGGAQFGVGRNSRASPSSSAPSSFGSAPSAASEIPYGSSIPSSGGFGSRGMSTNRRSRTPATGQDISFLGEYLFRLNTY